MLGSDRVQRVFERNTRAMTLKPKVAQGTARTTVRVVENLRCEVEEGPWRLTTDLPETSGGDDTAPTPGVLGRAALGSCLAMTYVMWAARLDVQLTSLEVEIEAEYDARGVHGVGDAVPGYESVRYHVSVASPATREVVLDMLDQADAHCDYLSVFSRPQTVERQVRWVG